MEASEEVAAHQQHQQPGGDRGAPHGKADGQHGAERRGDPLAAPKVEEDGIHVTQTGGDTDEPQIDGLDLQIPGEIDGRPCP